MIQRTVEDETMRTLLLTALAAGLLMSTAASAQTLRIGLQEDPDVLDPHRARTFVGRIVFTSLCDKLVDITPDLKFVPRARDRMELERRRQDADHQAAPGRQVPRRRALDAAAVKANIDRARTLPDSLRKSELTSVESVEAVDDLTVVAQADATRCDAARRSSPTAPA